MSDPAAGVPFVMTMSVYPPAAGKLKIRHREEQMVKEMMLEGVISILEGMNPRMMETKLKTFLLDAKDGESVAEAAA